MDQPLDDGLVGEPGVFGLEEWELAYHRAVRRVLLPDPDRALQMVVLPSFRPELAVYVVDERRRHEPRRRTVVTGQVATQLWGAASEARVNLRIRGVQTSHPPAEAEFAALSPEVAWARAPLGDAAFESVLGLWNAAIAAGRLGGASGLCLDGVSLHFAASGRSGWTHSPPEGSVRAELARVGLTLVELARLADEAQRPAQEQAIVAAATRLVERIRTSG